MAAIAGLWLPGLLGVFGVLDDLGPAWAGTTAWLFLPLCGPEHVLPLAALASAVLAVGAVLAVWTQRPWPWLVAACTSPLVYGAVVHAQSVSFQC